MTVPTSKPTLPSMAEYSSAPRVREPVASPGIQEYPVKELPLPMMNYKPATLVQQVDPDDQLPSSATPVDNGWCDYKQLHYSNQPNTALTITVYFSQGIYKWNIITQY